MNPSIAIVALATFIMGSLCYVVYVGLKYHYEEEELKLEKLARKKAKKEKKRLKSLSAGHPYN